MHVSWDDGESGVGGFPDRIGQAGDAVSGFVVVRALHAVLVKNHVMLWIRFEWSIYQRKVRNNRF